MQIQIELINAEELAKIIKVRSVKAVYDVEFPPSTGIVVRIGRRIRWNKARLMAWLESGGERHL